MAETPTGSRRKPRVCQFCNRQFRRYEHLERHLRIHTNEKPYKCACGSSFSRRDLLKRHQNIGHGPITPSTQQHSPAIRIDSNDDSSAPVVFPWQSLGLQNTSPGSAREHGPFSDYQLDGNPLFSAQDLQVLQDLEMFSNNMGLNNEWYLPSEHSITQIFAGESNINSLLTPSTTNQSHEQPCGPDQTLSKLPTERIAVAEFGVLTLPILTVTNQHRERLLQALKKSCSPIPATSLPSCHSLSRFVNGFFDGFYPHLPMIHIPTFKIDECEPEILLAMCALGAESRHETRKALLLFRAAKDMMHRTIREQDIAEGGGNQLRSAEGGLTHLSHEASISHFEVLRQRAVMREARCLFLLIAFATWQKEEDVSREAFNLQSSLARCVRECHLEETEWSLYADGADWHSWVRQESDRRLKLFAFAFLNIHSMAFGTPPVILAEEINLRLPCSCLEWIAPNEEKWNLVRSSGHQNQMRFQEALCQIMKSHGEPDFSNAQPVPSPLANYILLHAVIQQILLVYHAFGRYNDVDHTLISGQKEVLRNALHAWTSLWQRAPESSLDPRNPNGPVTFTSTALLGVAYVRLGLNLGPYRILRYRNAKQIANQLLEMPRLPPGPHLLPAILHATHALSIPVKLGVNFVAQSHAFVWSVQHSLCGVEFAIFLNKWLSCISDLKSTRPLDEHETRLVGWISDIVEEGRTSGDDDLWPKPVHASDCAYLGFAVVKLWARLIRGNEQWSLMRVIGDGLDMYADICRQNVVQSSTTTALST